MKGFFKFVLIPLVVVAVAANMKDVIRYIKIRNM